MSKLTNEADLMQRMLLFSAKGQTIRWPLFSLQHI